MNSWESWEDAILSRQDSMDDDCASCEYKHNCKNQCSEITTVYNPNILQWMKNNKK